MFEKFNRYWEEYGFEGLAILAGLVIIVLFLYQFQLNILLIPITFFELLQGIIS